LIVALKDLVVQPKVLTFPTGEVTIYPLTMKDVIMLVQQYAPEMNTVMDGQVDWAKMIVQAPAFVSALVAQAAREPESADIVATLPFSVQLLALQTIWDLSSVDGDMLGKLVLRMAAGMQKLNSQLREQSVELLRQDVASLGKPA
jgi:hypothetical protein